MKADRWAGLRDLAASLPPDAAVPVPSAWLIELLDGTVDDAHVSDAPAPDLTIAQVAARFGRDPSTVRGWVTSGRLTGAYRFRGHELRVPVTAVLDFEARQRQAPTLQQSAAVHRPSRKPADLGSWRKLAS